MTFLCRGDVLPWGWRSSLGLAFFLGDGVLPWGWRSSLGMTLFRAGDDSSHAGGHSYIAPEQAYSRYPCEKASLHHSCGNETTSPLHERNCVSRVKANDIATTKVELHQPRGNETVPAPQNQSRVTPAEPKLCQNQSCVTPAKAGGQYEAVPPGSRPISDVTSEKAG